MKLLLADDHVLFRDALSAYIERAEKDSSVLIAGTLDEAIAIAEDDPYIDLILLDLKMPGMNGLNGIEKMKNAHPDLPIALISGTAEKKDVEEAIRLGAAGYFPKTLPGTALLSALHEILEGETSVAMNGNDIVPSYYGDGAQDVSLTPREKEVLSHLLRGASNKEIGKILDLQVVTVKLHVRGICRKFNVQNRTQAALRARELGYTA